MPRGETLQQRSAAGFFARRWYLKTRSGQRDDVQRNAMAIPERISTQETMISGPSAFARVGEYATDRLSDKRATSNRRQRKGFCLDPWERLAELTRRASLITE